MSATVPPEAASEAPCEERLLGFWTCTALVVGNTIGIGIFMLPAVLAPFGFNALVGWGVTALGCVILAWVFARLARVFPDAEGPYDYVRRTQGRIVAFLALWCYWFSVWITNAAIAIGVVGYLQAIIPGLTAPVPAPVVALGLIWLFVAINLRGIRAGGAVQIVTATLKLLPMAAVILLGLWLLVSDPGVYTAQPPTTPISLPQVMAASTLALFAMLGLESAAVPAGRVRDPARTIPRATLVGTILTAAIYFAVSAVPILLIPQAELGASEAPFADLIARLIGSSAGQSLALFVVISGVGALNGWTMLVGELTRTMAERGALPSFLSACNGRGVPVRALVLTGVLASLMVLMNYSESLVDGFAFLSSVVTAANLPLYLCASVALVVLWFRRATTREILVIGLLGTAYSVFAFIGVGGEPFLWALALGAAGLPLYWLLRR